LTTNQTYSEQELAQLLRLRDQSAFTYLYDSYSGALYGVIQQVVPDQSISSDILQDVFVKIWRQIEKYDATKGRLFTWMYNIARNTAIDVLKSKGWQNEKKTDQLDVIHLNAELVAERNDEAGGVNHLIQHLKEEFKEIMNLSYTQGYTQEEIATLLRIPVGTVKTRMRAALLQLRKNFSIEK
jgi:RNA polymerase sigma factor (sigma-70 family)